MLASTQVLNEVSVLSNIMVPKELVAIRANTRDLLCKVNLTFSKKVSKGRDTKIKVSKGRETKSHALNIKETEG
jgi:hypothetical protein